VLSSDWHCWLVLSSDWHCWLVLSSSPSLNLGPLQALQASFKWRRPLPSECLPVHHSLTSLPFHAVQSVSFLTLAVCKVLLARTVLYVAAQLLVAELH
jgi:hypothetical protein